MEPTVLIFEAIMYPSAIFAAHVPSLGEAVGSPKFWSEFSLNPKKGSKVSQPLQDVSWRIDGGEADGTRFFAIPNFALGKPPLRMDTWITDQYQFSRSLRKSLQTNSAMFVSSSQVSKLALSDRVLRALHSWSSSQPDFENSYWAMPFGSRIVIEEMFPDVQSTKIHFIPIYEIEQRWLSVQKLQAMWQLHPGSWPPSIDHTNLKLQRQLHEAISVVSILEQGVDTRSFIFKSLVNDVKYMYHELKLLLNMPSHPNVISKPLYIVTKKSRFGGKVGVCGFILPYLPYGTLQDMLSGSTTFTLSSQVRWARELTEALMHVRASPTKFYSNLKPNNVLMSPTSPSSLNCDPNSLDVKLIDFEQHTGWYSWSPPEVSYIEYLDYLVSSEITPGTARAHFENLLRSYYPAYRPRSRIFYYDASDASETYSPGWTVLSASEQTSAQVYLLGMILWCIFEAQPSLNNFITVETFREVESRQSFPEFKKTPTVLQALIKKCTAGAREWRGLRQPLVRVGHKLYPRDPVTGEPKLEVGSQATQEVAREWWKQELADAEAFVEARKLQKRSRDSDSHDKVGFLSFMVQRPSLEEVLDALDHVEASSTQSC